MELTDIDKVEMAGRREIERYPIGKRVTLRMFGGKYTGEIVAIDPPAGVLSPRYKVRYDGGQESGWLYRSDFKA